MTKYRSITSSSCCRPCHHLSVARLFEVRRDVARMLLCVSSSMRSRGRTSSASAVPVKQSLGARLGAARSHSVHKVRGPRYMRLRNMRMNCAGQSSWLERRYLPNMISHWTQSGKEIG
jgi:hypothetical protein